MRRGAKEKRINPCKRHCANRLFSILAAVLLAGLFLSGCKGGRPAAKVEEEAVDMAEAASGYMTEEAVATETELESLPEEEKVTTETAKVGICLARTANGDNDRLLMELLPELELRGFLRENILVKKMTGSRKSQDSQILECLEEKCSLLIVSAVSDGMIPEMADKINEAGASGVFINCDPGDEELARWEKENMSCAWIGSTYVEVLACQMKILYDYSGTERGLDFNQDGHVGAILVGGGEEAHAALEEAVRDLGTELQILGETDSVDAQEISDYMEQVINERKKEVELVLCSTEAGARAAAEGVRLRHRLVGRDILVIGADAHEESCTAIINKLMSGSVFTDFYEQASLAAVAAKDLIEGNQGNARISAVLVKVTEENAQEILDQLWMVMEAAQNAATAAAAAETGETAATAAAAAETAEAAATAAAAETAETAQTGENAATAAAAAETAEAAATAAAAETGETTETAGTAAAAETGETAAAAETGETAAAAETAVTAGTAAAADTTETAAP